MSLALLPFENGTGHPDLDWVELGLMSLVIKAIGAQPRTRVASVQALLTALE